MAQENPGAEVSGGFSYLHAGPGSNLYGWGASVARNLNNWFGIVGEFSGHYQSGGSIFNFAVIGPGIGLPTPPIVAPAPVVAVSADSNLYTFLFGPRFSYRTDKRFTPFVHILPGLARSHTSGTVTTQLLVMPPVVTNVHFSDSGNAFAMAIGGGFDMKLSKSLAFRVLQADYLLTRFGGATQNNARLTTGLVYRFGK
jgi:opacity protein-like surface antigen